MSAPTLLAPPAPGVEAPCAACSSTSRLIIDRGSPVWFVDFDHLASAHDAAAVVCAACGCLRRWVAARRHPR